jgi:ketosteroid isomerase-like protein
MEEALRAAKVLVDAENARDADAAAAAYADDCHYRMPHFGIDTFGRAHVRQHYEAVFTAFPDFTIVEEEWHVAGPHAFGEVQMEATHLGPGPFGDTPASGRRVRIWTMSRFTIGEAGLLCAGLVCIDPIDMLHQLGALRPGTIQDIWTELRTPHPA